MPCLFLPWRKFFETIKQQPEREEWLRSAIFNDRGVLVDETPPPARERRNRPVSPLFRVRRDLEAFADLRVIYARGPRNQGRQPHSGGKWSF
jgi:hypothetical protein